MYKLYGRQGTGSDAPRILLEQGGHEYEFVDVSPDAQQSDNFSHLNAMKQLPVLMLPSGTLVTESGAICLLIAELESDANLLSGTGTDGRADVYRWMFFAATNLYEDYRRNYHADQYINENGEEALRDSAVYSLKRHWALVDDQIADRETLIGDSMTVVDIYLAMLADWSVNRAELWDQCKGVKRMCKNVGSLIGAQKVGVAQEV